MNISKSSPLRGEITVPGDKSISHRAVMLGAITEGTTRIDGFLNSADCLSTAACLRSMGIDIEMLPGEGAVLVHGRGLHGLKAPEGVLDAGNSGTTVRLLSGILAGQPFESILDGDASLRKRPMRRVIRPLTMMGARISGESESGTLPLKISGSALKGISYHSPTASAQVKSCILLAGLYADQPTSVTEPALSRDHTERMLRAFGADVRTDGLTASVYPGSVLHAADITVPGDISSAAYFIAAALIVPGSEVMIRNVGMNPTRCGFLEVCRNMGADITICNERSAGAEPAADLLVRSGVLKGTTVEGDIIPTLIDELPMVALLGAYADGETVIRDAAELRVKESDRIAVVTENLRRMGGDITPFEDGMCVRGGEKLRGCRIDPHHDHRIAMSFAAAAMGCTGTTTISDASCVRISYPDYFRDLLSLQRR